MAIVMKDKETPFYNFSTLIPEVREESYWLRLNKLRMFSQKGANGEMPVCLVGSLKGMLGILS